MSNRVDLEVKFIDCWFGEQGEVQEGAEHFWVGVQIFIGEVGEDLYDSFDVFVCSPSMFAEKYAADRWVGDPFLEDETLPGGTVMPLTGIWLMKMWSRDDLERAVHRLIPAYSPGPDFGTVAARIGRVAPWEYDYRFDDETNDAAGIPRPPKSFRHDEAM